MVLPEIINAGIYNSKIVTKGAVAVSKNRSPSLFEIELPLDNEGVSYIDDQSAPISKHMLICAKPGQIRHTKFPYKCYYVHIRLEEGALRDILMNSPDFIEIEKRSHYKDLFSRLIRHHSAPNENSDILLQSLILDLIYQISRETAHMTMLKRGKTNHGERFAAVFKYIDENLTKELSLESVAKAAHLSPIHFHNTFKAAVGKTLRDYVEEQRIKKAVQLLTNTSLTLAQIAYECGFSSQSYFSYVFKRRMKKTPRQYVYDFYNQYEI